MMERGRKRNENRMFPKSLNSSCEQYQRKKAKEERKKKKWGEKTLNFINNPPFEYIEHDLYKDSFLYL